MSLILEKKKRHVWKRESLFDNNQYIAETRPTFFGVMQEKNESLVSIPNLHHFSKVLFQLTFSSWKGQWKHFVRSMRLTHPPILLHHQQNLLINELDGLRGINFICLDIAVSRG